ncbi:hypothetical protein M8494_09615 [Serratia ureilytica]
MISIQSQVVYGSVGNGIAYRALLKKGWKRCRCPACCSAARPITASRTAASSPASGSAAFSTI